MMKHFLTLGLAAVFAAGATMASAWTEPKPGSAERKALMDVARPIAEWALGAPIEFRVETLRVEGDRAFAVITAQRPGGGAIDIRRSPMVTRDDFSPDMIDGPRLEVLYKKSGGHWVPVLHAVGATDVWFAWEPICKEWGSVIKDYCG